MRLRACAPGRTRLTARLDVLLPGVIAALFLLCRISPFGRLGNRRLQKKQRGRSPAWTAKSFFYTSTLFRNHSFLEGYQSAGPTDAVNVQASRVGFGPLLALHAMLFSAFSVECTAAATFTCATSSLCTWKDVAVGRSVVGTMPHGPTCCLRGSAASLCFPTDGRANGRGRVRTAMGWDGDMVTGTGSGGMGRGSGDDDGGPPRNFFP